MQTVIYYDMYGLLPKYEKTVLEKLRFLRRV